MNSRHAILAISMLLAACSGTGVSDGEDPFFRMLLMSGETATVPPSPQVRAGAPAREYGPDSLGPGGYRLEFRFLRTDGAAIATPALVVRVGEPASVSIVDQVSYIEDFDVEVDAAAWLADPVVGIVQTGLQAEVVATPIEGTDRIALAWAFVQSGLTSPIRERTIPLAPEAAPITIQFPSTPVTRCEGRTVIPPGAETLLAVTPLALGSAAETTHVSILIEPATWEPPPDPSAFLGTEIEISMPPPILGPVDPDTPPPSAGLIEITVAEMPADADGPYLDPIEAARPLKRFEVRSGAERGTKVSCLLKKAYLRDYRLVSEGGKPPVDPQIDQVEVGFTAEFVTGGSTPDLKWRLSTYHLLGDFYSNVTGTDLMVPLEIPVITEKAGTLTLTGEMSSVEIARTDDGRSIVLIVCRIHDA